MHKDILPYVIFSPAELALSLAEGLQKSGAEVTLFSPGPIDTNVANINADLSYFQNELDLRGDTYLDLLKKHPVTFVTLARQVQSELVAKAYEMANNDELDLVHVYTNEEDIALPYAKLCRKPVVFTHHDPFNFLVKYKNVFPKYKDLNWISMSYAQRQGMPSGTNWIGNVYHGVEKDSLSFNAEQQGDYAAYLGRIIQPKGVHLAIEAVKLYNKTADKPLKLKIAGKHYAGHRKDTYWQEKIEPHIDGHEIEYVGFIGDSASKQDFLGNAAVTIIPSLFDEPFGMVTIESLACGTPVIGLDSGALPEVIENSGIGFIVPKNDNDHLTSKAIAAIIPKALNIRRQECRTYFENHFTTDRMCSEHLIIYEKLTKI